MNNADELMALIRRRSQFPSDGDIRYENDGEILSVLNSTLLNDIYPRILEQEEGYYLKYQEHSLEGGQRRFVIPLDSYNRSLYEIVLIDANKNRLNVPEISITSRHQGFEVLSNTVILRNYAERFLKDKTLRLYYYPKMKPLTTEHATLSEKVGENYITEGQVFSDGEVACFQKKDNPFLYEKKSLLLREDTTLGTLLSPADPLPFDLALGDFITGLEDGLYLPPISALVADLLVIKTSLNLAIDDSSRETLTREWAEKFDLFRENTFSRVQKETASASGFNALWN